MAYDSYEITFRALDDVIEWFGYSSRNEYLIGTTGINAEKGRKILKDLE